MKKAFLAPGALRRGLSRAGSRSVEKAKKISEYKAFLAGDEDHDYLFILRLLKYKLERTRKHIAACHRGDREAVARQIRTVESLLGRVLKESGSEERQEKDLEAALNLMRKNIWNWWD